MDGKSHALGDRADGLKEMLALRGARLGMHHHVGRYDFADAFLNGIAERVNLFKTGGARHADDFEFDVFNQPKLVPNNSLS